MGTKLLNYQQRMKSLFDQKAKDIPLQQGDLVLRWDVRWEDKGKHGKFDPLWFSPFRIAEERGINTFLLEKLDGELLELLVNGQFLKLCFQKLRISCLTLIVNIRCVYCNCHLNFLLL